MNHMMKIEVILQRQTFNIKKSLQNESSCMEQTRLNALIKNFFKKKKAFVALPTMLLYN